LGYYKTRTFQLYKKTYHLIKIVKSWWLRWVVYVEARIAHRIFIKQVESGNLEDKEGGMLALRWIFRETGNEDGRQMELLPDRVR
jgi:hypothetical protein